jgi:hypothetical protein
LIIAGAGFTTYHVLPVIGPDAYFGTSFPYDIGLSTGPKPRNCMPSLHTAWVLVPFLTSRGMPIVRVITGCWLALMLLATLGFGEHYLLDLICALPFMLAVRAVCATDLPWSARPRWSALLNGVAVFSIWGLAIRGGVHPARVLGLAPAMMIVTIAVSILSERYLAQAQGLFRPVRQSNVVPRLADSVS